MCFGTSKKRTARVDVFGVDYGESLELLGGKAVDFLPIFIASTQKLIVVTRIIKARRIRDACGLVEIEIFRPVRTQFIDISKPTVIEIAC